MESGGAGHELYTILHVDIAKVHTAFIWDIPSSRATSPATESRNVAWPAGWLATPGLVVAVKGELSFTVVGNPRKVTVGPTAATCCQCVAK